MLPKSFIPAFKQAGFKVSQEGELVSRLNEAANWQGALLTLLKHGARIGLSFSHSPGSKTSVHQLARRFSLAPAVEAQLRLI